MEATAEAWDITPEGRRVDCILLANATGMSVRLINYGATIISVKTPSKESSVPQEITLCYDKLSDLMSNSPYYGCTVGRVANRIAGGVFHVDGKEYRVAQNNGVNHLHGGVVGFDKRIWSYKIFARADAVGVRFTYRSHDGEEGYPGQLDATATYTLTETNEIHMLFEAATTATTPINMCNHTYWNLSGNLEEHIDGHDVTIHCPYYIPSDASLIPTGEVRSVEGTLFDLRSVTRLADRLHKVDGGGKPGYDHCFARGADIAKAELDLGVVATLQHATSGRKMTVSTTAPGVQLYTGNFLSVDKADAPHDQHRALCLETENFPNSVNQKSFPSPLVAVDAPYRHLTVHKFEW